MNRFNGHDRLVHRSMGAFIALWVFSFIVSLALSGALVYVAWHFVTKFW
jgi:hypothetical protein